MTKPLVAGGWDWASVGVMAFDSLSGDLKVISKTQAKGFAVVAENVLHSVPHGVMSNI
jgi:hypothetical protein